MCWSVPLGTLSTLGTRGTASVLVVEVDAEPGMNYHHTVVMPVPAVFVCEQRRGGRRGWSGDKTEKHINTLSHRHTHTNLGLVDCRVLCCRFAPVQVWCSDHTRGCAFCLVLDTVPPSFVSLSHKNVSTEEESREAERV